VPKPVSPRARHPAVHPPIRWPRGVASAVCLTFDLDAETAGISRDPANDGRLAVMSQGAYGPKVGVPLIPDFLEANGLRATFFVPGWTAERYPDVVAEIGGRPPRLPPRGVRGTEPRRGGGDPPGQSRFWLPSPRAPSGSGRRRRGHARREPRGGRGRRRGHPGDQGGE
jgi:peptidoglycan/xylan/chitin deacetylase (PgdA/CDA1 family)